MRITTISALVLALMATVGCQKNSGSTTGGARASLAAAGAAAGLSLVGTVSASSAYQTQFQSAVTGLLSTDVNPAYVGTVNATPSPASGVYFGGTVSLSTGSVRTAAVSGGTVTGGKLAVQVYDNSGIAGAPAIPEVLISNASGYIQGNQAMIQFYDDYGTVTLQGTVDTTNNVFTGSMSYDNTVMYDGSSPGAAGTMGSFSVPLCQFFSC